MSIQSFDISKNYAAYLIDTSYIVFCAATAAFKDYVFEQDIPKSTFSPDLDPTLDPEFNIILKSKFEWKTIHPIKNYIPFSYDRSKFIFTLDCPRKEIWRREVFPEYKLSRDEADHSKDEFNIGKVFNYVYNKLIPDFCDEFGCTSVKSTCAESDDIIAVATKYFLNENKTNNVIILSSDRDMVQLVNDRVTLIAGDDNIRQPKKELQILTKSEINKEIDSSDFLLFKILIGDSSDDIPSVKHRFGPKSALKVILDESKNRLKNLLKEDVEILNGFKRNKKLISMNEIPDYIKNSIEEDIKEALTKVKNNDDGSNSIKECNDIDDLLKDLL